MTDDRDAAAHVPREPRPGSSGNGRAAGRMSSWRRCMLGGAALSTALLLTGCGGGSGVTSQLAQVASDATAQTRTVALTLQLATRGRSLSTVDATAVRDSITKLGQDDASLTQLQASGAQAAMRNEVLRRVRAAEDEALQARSALAFSAPSVSAARPVLARLARTAAKLSALQKRLEGSS